MEKLEVMSGRKSKDWMGRIGVGRSGEGREVREGVEDQAVMAL